MTMGPIRVLLVDNEVDAREWLAEWLRQTHAFDVRTTSTSEEALSQMALANGDFDVVVTDVRLGHGLNGIETMKDMHHLYPEIPVIIITAYGSVDDGVRAMKEGAYHYVFKPLNRDEIVIDIRSAADQRRLKRERDWLRALSDVSEALSAPALDQEGVVRAVYEQALQFIPHAQAFSLALYDDHTGDLSFPLAMDQGQPVRIPSRRLTESSESWGLTGWIVKHARPLLINDVQHETLPVPDAASGEASTSARSFLGLPLVARGQVIGAISVQCHDPFALTPDHQRFLEAVTNQAATAIENTRLYAQAQREISVRTRAEKELRRYQEHLQELVRERTAELQQSESRYRTLFDGMPVPLYRTTAAGQIVDANPAMLQMLGYSRR